MLIVLDIGNTSVTYGFFEQGKLLRFGSKLFVDIPHFIQNCFKSGGGLRVDLVISSVVPKNTQKLLSIFGNKKGLRVWIAGKNLPISIKHRYSPGQLGMDRIINVFGALRLYSPPPFLIIDYGTAITLDYVSQKGVLEGGMIIPGPQIAFQSLVEQAALLPKKARLPQAAASFLGHNTYECMKTGILHGFGALTDGLVGRFKARYGSHLKVIATGGFAQHLKPYSKTLRRIDPKLSVKSLYLLFQEFHPD